MLFPPCLKKDNKMKKYIQPGIEEYAIAPSLPLNESNDGTHASTGVSTGTTIGNGTPGAREYDVESDVAASIWENPFKEEIW